MFISSRVSMHLKSVVFKTVPSDSGKERVAAVTCQLEPFSSRLAHELGMDVAEHCFVEEGPDFRMREEVGNVAFRPQYGLQRVIAYPDANSPRLAVLEDVTVASMRVVRQEDEKRGTAWWKFCCTLLVGLADAKARAFLADYFDTELCFDFHGIQRDLVLEEQRSASVAESAD